MFLGASRNTSLKAITVQWSWLVFQPYFLMGFAGDIQLRKRNLTKKLGAYLKTQTSGIA